MCSLDFRIQYLSEDGYSVHASWTISLLGDFTGYGGEDLH